MLYEMITGDNDLVEPKVVYDPKKDLDDRQRKIIKEKINEGKKLHYNKFYKEFLTEELGFSEDKRDKLKHNSAFFDVRD